MLSQLRHRPSPVTVPGTLETLGTVRRTCRTLGKPRLPPTYLSLLGALACALHASGQANGANLARRPPIDLAALLRSDKLEPAAGLGWAVPFTTGRA
jgi:hypothetical protein